MQMRRIVPLYAAGFYDRFRAYRNRMQGKVVKKLAGETFDLRVK
jgi:hypothetical protein